MDVQRKDPIAPVSVRISCAPEDEMLCEQLLTHLRPLEHPQGLITLSHNRQIPSGTDLRQQVTSDLEQDLLLLLISSDFLSSDYGMEMQRVLQHRQTNQARVIPILLRPVDRKNIPFHSLRALPTNAKFIKRWSNRDEAWADVVEGIRKVIEGVSGTSRTVLSDNRHLPYSKNRFFTGRDDMLRRLRRTFEKNPTVAQALSGLGGIGKTQIAIEYAYRYFENYRYVFWAQAESEESLIRSYMEFASRLALPEQKTSKQDIIIQAVKNWLENQDQWLLVLDNADTDKLTIIEHFIPRRFKGHILLTTRASALGDLASRVEVEELPLEQAALLLLRRASRLPLGHSLKQIESKKQELAFLIARQLGGIPLALDLAGAYLEETGCSLAEYYQLWQKQGASLLQKRQEQRHDSPASAVATWQPSFKSVVAIWQPSFQRAEQKNPAAAEILRLCAWLSAESIPKKLLVEGATYLGPLLGPVASNLHSLNEAIKILKGYSLVNCDPEREALSLHHLVQTVLQDFMGNEMSKQWRERAVKAVSASFPNPEDASLWAMCEEWMPHALLCAIWIEQDHMIFPEATHLLTLAGLYLRERARYEEARPLLEHVLTIDKQREGDESPLVATDQGNLAYLFWSQGNYQDAKQSFQHALEIRQKWLDEAHPDLAESLQNLACLYQTLGNFEESEQLFQSAIAIDKQGTESTLAVDLSNLAEIYRRQGKYEQAESLLRQALVMCEKYVGQEHLDTAHIFHKRGLLAYQQGKLDEAESFFRQTLVIYEKQLGYEHPNTAQIFNALGELSSSQGKFDEAEALFLRALEIKKRYFGEIHSSTAATMNGLALLYLQQGKYIFVRREQTHSFFKKGRFDEAEQLFRQALEIREQVLGKKHLNTALVAHNLACLYQAQADYEKAEPLFLDAFRVYEELAGSEHLETIHILHNLIYFYSVQERFEEAEQFWERAMALHEKLLEQNSPRGLLLQQQNAVLLDVFERQTEILLEEDTSLEDVDDQEL